MLQVLELKHRRFIMMSYTKEQRVEIVDFYYRSNKSIIGRHVNPILRPLITSYGAI